VPEKQEAIGLAVLGSTGSIGRMALEIASRYPDRIRVLALAAGRNAEELHRQQDCFNPEFVALGDPDEVCRAAAWPGADVIVNGIVGAAGLRPSLAALEAGRRLALANKESLVLAGHLLRQAQDRFGGEILPVDSEHSAIAQCLGGIGPAQVGRVILTASGGPFRERDPRSLAEVTPADALRHPTWTMGRRITIDSATLFNKGMELIEAHWLFDLPFERLSVWIHPQSIVHGLVETVDGSLIAQLAVPDMRLPIQWAIAFPERWDPPVARCDLASLGRLDFAEPDEARFPCLGLVLRAGRIGGTAPAVVNAADEVLVAAFLEGRISFPQIAEGLAAVLERHDPAADPYVEEILAADAWARRAAAGAIEGAGGHR